MSNSFKQAALPIGILAAVALFFFAVTNSQPKPATQDPPPIVKEKEVAKPKPVVEKKAPSRTIMLHTSNWEFSPNEIRVKKGENVSLHLMGIEGNHGLAIPGLGISERMFEGSMTMVKIPTDKTGSFDFFCNVSCGAGHADMQGTIIIE